MFRVILGGIALVCAATGISPVAAQDSPVARDGQKDFDFELGTWTTSVRVLRNPLSGQAPDWAEYKGTSVVRPLLDGRANFVELSVAGAKGKIEGGSLRLYNPQTRQWSLNFASLRNGMLTAPVYGGFGDPKRGTFYGQDMVDGRAVLVRFIVTLVSPSEAHFDQAFSADGGVTWETNWVAVDTLRTRSTG
jgi:hypothetical protein